MRCVFSYKNCRCDRQCINTTTWQCLALLLCCYGERESRFLTAHQHKTGATPWGGWHSGGGACPPLLEPGALPQMKRELQWKNRLTWASLLAVKVVTVNVMALSLLSFFCSVNEHYILLIIVYSLCVGTHTDAIPKINDTWS